MHSPADLSSFLADWRNFPHRLDFRSGRLLYLRVEAGTLENSAFLDGRTPLSTDGREYVVELDAARSAWPETARPGPVPMIFHTAFCGSTLLARLLTQPGRSLCLREPQILADIAAWHAATDGAQDEGLSQTLKFVLAQLGRPVAGAAMSVKPTNWINPMLGPLIDAGVSRAVFLTSELRALLIAALRGGNDRIAYLNRYTVHAARSQPALMPLIQQATASGSALDKALRLCALSLLSQQAMFASVSNKLACKLVSSGRVSFDTLVASPQAIARKVAGILDLSSFDPDGPLAGATGYHAKADGEFNGRREANANASLLARYEAEISGAEDWARKITFPPAA